MFRRGEAGQGGFGSYLWNHKRWWLLPIVGVLLLLAILVVQSSSGSSPFAYTLF